MDPLGRKIFRPYNGTSKTIGSIIIPLDEIDAEIKAVRGQRTQ